MKSGLVFGVLAALAVAGCKGSGSGSDSIVGTNSFVDSSALSAFFVADFAPYESAAQALRTLDPRYTMQKIAWVFPGNASKAYYSNSLAHARVEYAHAAGLTGAGQTIAILDDGFLTSHDEFAGKVINMPGGTSAPGVADHGTAVASIAAGSATSGSMIGVAPGADLQLGSYNTFSSMTTATNQARAVGAIVQNNSWGYELSVSKENYRTVLGGTGGQAYVNSLRDFAKDGVVVFAASNKSGRTSADLLAALPKILPELEESWIAAVNGVPTFKGDRITRAQRLSSKCLEAAAWCVAADGTYNAATAAGNSSYALIGGTSMAAPTVSGAVALLAEAFPTLSAKELRARLLASANNRFYKHTGYVAFTPKLKHGYNETWGHGFIDLKAALLPIGGSFMPVKRGKGRVRVDKPILMTGGMAGNALSRSLGDHDFTVVDGLGAGFELPASILTAEAVADSGRMSALALLTGSANDPMANAFPVFAAGHQMDLSVGDTRIALLMPSEGGTTSDFGFSVLHELADAAPGLSVGLTAMREGDGFVGMESLLGGSRISGTHVSAVMGLTVPLSDRHDLRLSGAMGVAMPDGDMPAMEMSTVGFNSVGVTYGINDLARNGDRMTFGLNLPQVVRSGVAEVALPTVRSNGTVQTNSFDVDLAPEERQMDLTFSYAMPMSKQTEVTFSAVHSLNDGHVAGRRASGAGIGFQMRF